MPHQALERVEEIGAVGLGLRERRPGLARHLARERALVETRVGVAHGEGAHGTIECRTRGEQHGRGIETAREAGAHRHVRAEVDAHGISQQRTKALSRLALADVEGSRLLDPIPSVDR